MWSRDVNVNSEESAHAMSSGYRSFHKDAGESSWAYDQRRHVPLRNWLFMIETYDLDSVFLHTPPLPIFQLPTR
jgi:hypothetical protein